MFYKQPLLYLNQIAQIHNKKIIRSSSLCVKSLYEDRVSRGKVIPVSRALVISRVKPFVVLRKFTLEHAQILHVTTSCRC